MKQVGILLVTTLLIGTTSALGNGWPAGKKKWVLVPGFYQYRATQYRNDAGRRIDYVGNGRFTSYRYQLYAEYGLNDRLTLVGKLPVVTAQFTDNAVQHQNAGLGDVELGARYTLANLNNQYYVAGQATVWAPPYQNRLAEQPFLGLGRWATEAKLIFCGSLSQTATPVFFSTEVGGRHFFGEGGSSVQQLTYQVLGGVYLTPRTQLMADVSGLRSMSRNAGEFNPRNLPLNTQFGYTKLSANVGQRLTPRAWLHVGGFYDVQGRRAGVGRGLTAMAIIRF